MLVHGPFWAKYGVQTTFYVALEDASAVDAPFVGTAPLVADIFLSKDGGAPAAATNAFAAIGNGVYSWVATATELQASCLSVSVYDQTASEIFKPIYFNVFTRLGLGTLAIDATQVGSNTDALTLTGIGTGFGLKLAGASDSYLTNLFAQLEGTEPTALAASMSHGAIIQAIKARLFYKVTQTLTVRTLYKSDGVTVLDTQAVSYDGTTQTQASAI